jgi:transcriptional regulator with XRE-family HTH domain
MGEPHSEASRIVGRRIRDRRLAYSVSQEDLAELAMIHTTNLGKIERGSANPSLHTLLRIAGALNADPGELLSGLTPVMLPDQAHPITAADLAAFRKRSAKRRE